MFTKHLSAFKLLIAVFTLVVCSSFIFIPPTFAGPAPPKTTGDRSSTSNGNPGGSPCPRPEVQKYC